MHFWITVAAGVSACVAVLSLLNTMLGSHPDVSPQTASVASIIGAIHTMCAVSVFLYLLYS